MEMAAFPSANTKRWPSAPPGATGWALSALCNANLGSTASIALVKSICAMARALTVLGAIFISAFYLWAFAHQINIHYPAMILACFGAGFKDGWAFFLKRSRDQQLVLHP